MGEGADWAVGEAGLAEFTCSVSGRSAFTLRGGGESTPPPEPAPATKGAAAGGGGPSSVVCPCGLTGAVAGRRPLRLSEPAFGGGSQIDTLALLETAPPAVPGRPVREPPSVSTHSTAANPSEELERQRFAAVRPSPLGGGVPGHEPGAAAAVAGPPRAESEIVTKTTLHGRPASAVPLPAGSGLSALHAPEPSPSSSSSSSRSQWTLNVADRAREGCRDSSALPPLFLLPLPSPPPPPAGAAAAVRRGPSHVDAWGAAGARQERPRAKALDEPPLPAAAAGGGEGPAAAHAEAAAAAAAAPVQVRRRWTTAMNPPPFGAETSGRCATAAPLGAEGAPPRRGKAAAEPCDGGGLLAGGFGLARPPPFGLCDGERDEAGAVTLKESCDKLSLRFQSST